MPGAVTPIEILRRRADLFAAIRRFFAEREVLEVDTPVLSCAAATAPHLSSFSTCFHGPVAIAGTRYLQTSPEFPMKRLLAAGSGSIYQIARAFRDGELGGRHQPEFCILEWYRVGFDHLALMDDVNALLAAALGDSVSLGPSLRITYRELFQRHLGIDPHCASAAELSAIARSNGLHAPPGLTLDEVDPWLELLLSHVIQPALQHGRPIFIHDYPVSQAALARVRGNHPAVAERFELYMNGIELANGFHELNDAVEQRRRFASDNATRAALGMPVMPLDERLLAALPLLPDCAGVALGLDRLLMLALGVDTLDCVLPVPFDRA